MTYTPRISNTTPTTDKDVSSLLSEMRQQFIPKGLASRLGINPLTISDLRKFNAKKYEQMLATLLKEASKTEDVLDYENIKTGLRNALQLCHDPMLDTRKYSCEAICKLYMKASEKEKQFIASIMVDSVRHFSGNISKHRLPDPMTENRPSKQFCEIAISHLLKLEMDDTPKRSNNNDRFILGLCLKTLQTHMSDYHRNELDGDYTPKEPDTEKSSTLRYDDNKRVRLDPLQDPTSQWNNVQIHYSHNIIDSKNTSNDHSSNKNNDTVLYHGSYQSLSNVPVKSREVTPNSSQKNNSQEKAELQKIGIRTIIREIEKVSSSYNKENNEYLIQYLPELPIDESNLGVCKLNNSYDKLKGLPYDFVYMDLRDSDEKVIEKYIIHRVPCGTVDLLQVRQPNAFIRNIVLDIQQEHEDYDPGIMHCTPDRLNGFEIISRENETFFCDMKTGEVTCIWAEKVPVDQKNNPVTENSLKRGFKRFLRLFG